MTLARVQAVRFRVVGEGRRIVQPWCDPPGSALETSTRIEVFARDRGPSPWRAQVRRRA